MESILIIVVSVAITALLFGIPKGKPKKSKYDWSLKGFFNDPTGDVVHFPSKKRRR